FIIAGGLPFRRLPGRKQGLSVVKPEFHHPVVIPAMPVSRYSDATALYDPARSGNPRPNGAMDIFPVTKEFLVRQVRLLGDAINKLDHNGLRVGYGRFGDFISLHRGLEGYALSFGERLP